MVQEDISIVDVDVAEDLRIGSRLGDYEILERIGAGATSNVYRARHVHEGTEVAIKLLELTPQMRRTHIQRLRREAMVSIRVDHPNLVKVYEFGRVPAKCAYLVMELVRGKTLHDILCESGPLAPERAAKILRETAAGLVAAHAAGYVHRDLKPGNLMISERGGVEHVKILDFGIVGTADRSNDTLLTEEHSILGTPTYMAPEQLESPQVGPAADIYALGGILYHMLAGKPPFSGSFREIVAQQMVAAPDPLPHAEGLGPLAHWLLEKAPQKRPANAEMVVQAAETILAEIARRSEGACSDDQVHPPPPILASRSVSTWTNIGTWTSPIRRQMSRLVHWPLRVTIPIVAIAAITGGAFAARSILGEGAPAPQMGPIAAEGPPRAAGPLKLERRELELTSPGRATAGLLPLVEEPERTIEPVQVEQTLEFEDTRLTGSKPRQPVLVTGADILDDRPLRTYASRIPEHEVRALRARLNRVSAAIEKSRGVVSKRELRTFEARYKSLASMVRPEIGELGRDGLVSHIESLSAQIAVAQRKHRHESRPALQ